MTAKTTLSFTERHGQFLLEKLRQGVFATENAAVAAATEQMMQDEQEREQVVSVLSQEIRDRMEAPRTAFIDLDDAFGAARCTIVAVRGA